jgi:hypothetical protein
MAIGLLWRAMPAKSRGRRAPFETRLARLLSHRGLGLKPLPSSYRRRCKRLFCVLR